MVAKCAVIGCGRMGAQKSARLEGIVPSGWLPISHAESIEQTDVMSLVALVDNDEHRLADVSSDYDVDEKYLDYDKLLKGVQLDIVTVATRTPMKFDIIKSSILKGVRGIYVEKPLSNSLRKTVELLELADSHGCFLSYGVNRRFHYVYRKAKELLTDGAIGKLVEVSVEFGCSPLLWTHPHSMDMLTYFGGTPISVRADLDSNTFNLVSDNIVDSDPLILSAQIVFEGGVRGSISCGEGGVVRLLGSNGTMIIHGDGACIQMSTKSESHSPYFHDQKFITPQAPKGATRVAFEELAKVVQGNISEEEFIEKISPNDILYGQQLLLGCAWSHLNSNKYIDIDTIPSDLTVTGKNGQYFA